MLSRVAVLSSVVAVAFSANLHDRAYYEAKFIDWMTQHSIKPTTGSHFVQMLQNFANNDDIIETHNAKKLSYTLGHNKFSHMSNEEFKAFVQLNPMKPKAPSAEVHVVGDKSQLASSIDWVAKGAVTGVKDQGQCGSCWSFSTTGALEGAYFNAEGSLVSFSEQNLVDCDNFRNGGSDMGCNGGWMDNAFEWVNKNGGLCTESGYPYVSGTTKSAGDCKTSCAKNTKVQTKSGAQGYTDVKVNDVDSLKSALNKQTVSVAIQADQAAFQLYKSGVFTADCGADLDHGVLATGYGTSGGEEYWAVKNSWGTSWGQDGYIWLAIDVKAAEGQCGILSAASYPNLA